MNDERVRVVLHAWRQHDGSIYVDASFAQALRQESIDVATEQVEPDPPCNLRNDSAIDFVAQHLHAYLPAIEKAAQFTAVAIGKTVVDSFVKWAKERIRAQPYFRHEKTIVLYDQYNRPLKRVAVSGHADDEELKVKETSLV
jgi:hypothetical protein